MKELTKQLGVALLLGCFACGALSAREIRYTGPITTKFFVFPDETDTLTIVLDNNGAILGPPGSTIGWSFLMEWTARNNYLSFTGSSLGSPLSPETNNSFLVAYTDFIGLNGGPNGSLSPNGPDSNWTQFFDAATMNGVGSYQIFSDESLAILDAQDNGQITFNFDIFKGDPSTGGTSLLSDSFYGDSTAFSVTVTPEPGAFWLMCAAAGMAALCRVRKQTGTPRDR